MTLGEKIKTARKNAGLTQEQMAEKLMISRPAITKWENNKGLPDIENLKAISKLLNVSIDYLLNNGDLLDIKVIKEPIDIKAYGKGGKSKIKERIVHEKYPDMEVIRLIPEKLPTKADKVIDNLLWYLTDAPLGIPDIVNNMKLIGNLYYLVVNGDNQYLVIVSDEFMETHLINIKVDTKKRVPFKLGDIKYIPCEPIKYE